MVNVASVEIDKDIIKNSRVIIRFKKGTVEVFPK